MSAHNVFGPMTNTLSGLVRRTGFAHICLYNERCDALCNNNNNNNNNTVDEDQI
jgi:hypothetical protein